MDDVTIHQRWIATWMPWSDGRQRAWAARRAGCMGCRKRNGTVTRSELEGMLTLLYHRMGVWQLRGKRKVRWT